MEEMVYLTLKSNIPETLLFNRAAFILIHTQLAEAISDIRPENILKPNRHNIYLTVNLLIFS